MLVSARDSPLQSILQDDLFTTLQVAFHRQHRCPSQLALAIEVLWATSWTKRNQVACQGNRCTLSLEHIIRSALLQIEALKDSTTSSKKLMVLDRSYKGVHSSLDNYHTLLTTSEECDFGDSKADRGDVRPDQWVQKSESYFCFARRVIEVLPTSIEKLG